MYTLGRKFTAPDAEANEKEILGSRLLSSVGGGVGDDRIRTSYTLEA